MKKDNPFTLTFGKQPHTYVFRHENIDTIIGNFESDNPISQTYLISGIRGSGKTVLMTSVANELAQNGWIKVDLNATQDLLEDFALRLSDAYRSFFSIAEGSFDINVGGFGIGLSGKMNDTDSVGKINQLLNDIKKKGKRVIITIDEVLHNDNMRRFASQFQIFLREDYPVFLLMTGLYENIYAIQNDPSLTFLLRSPKIKLEPLSMLQITTQYMNIFDVDLNKAKKLANITKGYAFAFQAFGMLYWEYRDTLPLENILLKLDALLDDFVYKKIWQGMSDKDREVALAIPYDDPIKVQDICSILHMTSSSFSKYRERMINKGILCAPQRGYIAAALPRFSQVIQMYSF